MRPDRPSDERGSRNGDEGRKTILLRDIAYYQCDRSGRTPARKRRVSTMEAAIPFARSAPPRGRSIVERQRAAGESNRIRNDHFGTTGAAARGPTKRADPPNGLESGRHDVSVRVPDAETEIAVRFARRDHRPRTRSTENARGSPRKESVGRRIAILGTALRSIDPKSSNSSPRRIRTTGPVYGDHRANQTNGEYGGIEPSVIPLDRSASELNTNSPSTVLFALEDIFGFMIRKLTYILHN